MLFNSAEFLVFFPLVCIGYFLLPHRFRWLLLLAASYYFYMAWKAEYIVIIMVSTVIDYFCGLKMSGIADQQKRKPWLWLSLCTNLGITHVAFEFRLRRQCSNRIDHNHVDRA